jgi:hypothetical protein
MADASTPDVPKEQDGEEMVVLKVRRKDLQISDEELDQVCGGVFSLGPLGGGGGGPIGPRTIDRRPFNPRAAGYGTLDYGTGTCHGGD